MLNVEIKNALQDTPLCKYLNLAELEKLVAQCELRIYASGDLILEQGKKNIGMFIILDGIALVTAKVLGEAGTYLATLSRGNLFGEIGLIDQGPCATSVVASTTISCLHVSNKYFAMLAILLPEIKYKISCVIAFEVINRLQMLYQKITGIINNTDMTTRSLFGEVIQSLHRPSLISFAECLVSREELRQASLFEDFTHEEFETILSTAVFIKTSPQCTLIHENEKDAACYLVLKGAVQSGIIHNNKSAKLSVIGPIQFFCGLSLASDNQNELYNFTTCERAILMQFTQDQLQRLQRHHTVLWYKIFDWICKSLVALERSVDKLDVRLKSELYNR
ncbi:MAG: cyclic nucleotide-binding domain-containing protein [Gammaproteobacteria bacterium]|nr:cyclic nucleotide-binding domain-containing protein [Gammaproteobacteria bacterium]